MYLITVPRGTKHKIVQKQQTYIKVKDHSVSGEEFQVIVTYEYGYLETTPQPLVEKLPEYYKSETIFRIQTLNAISLKKHIMLFETWL